MMKVEPRADSALRVRRTYRATPQRVFEAWTTPEQIMQWYAPFDDWDTPVAEVDLRVGGFYRFGLAAPGREPLYEVGEYLEIEPPRRLVYTQRTLGGSAQGQDIVVTVEFIARAEDTEVVVTEEGYTDRGVWDMHEGGWQGFLARLGTLVEQS